MNSAPFARRILIVDDQQQIHDTFERVFGEKAQEDHSLSDFESKYLMPGKSPSGGPHHDSVEPKPTYVITHANSGEHAIELVQNSVATGKSYSVAFVDMRMHTGMDGLETIEAIWKIDPGIQMVVCTAFSDHVWEHVLDRLGRNDRLLLLKKPFEPDEARQLALALSEKSRLETIQNARVDDLGREVERRRGAEESMRAMAHRDALTQLPNRPYLIEKLTAIIDRHQNGNLLMDAVLFLDLDNFKIINDSLGHNAGDELLNQVASRLKECVRDQDTAERCQIANRETIRLGGDEFVVVLEQIVDAEDAVAVANRIVQRISEPFQLCGRLVTVGASVGIAYIGDTTTDAHVALRNADTAMYRAKNAGKGRVAVFDRSMHADIVRRMELENQFRRALDNEVFELNYQPIINLKDATVQGIEVLLRWRNEDGVYVSPSEFIPMAEEIGLIGRVGEWVLEQSMKAFTDILDRLPPQRRGVYMGVNTSRRQLSDPHFMQRLEQIFARTGFERHRLKLEINESFNPRQDKQALQTMLTLHDSGVGIQIDDFGKGQSSLTCFQSYPIEAVKIDRSFTASIAKDHSHAVIAQAIVQLAHHLCSKIVAEGVESREQLDCLRRWGCDAAQGYFFSSPLSAEQLFELLSDPMKCDGIRLLRQQIATPILFTQQANVIMTNESSL